MSVDSLRTNAALIALWSSQLAMVRVLALPCDLIQTYIRTAIPIDNCNDHFGSVNDTVLWNPEKCLVLKGMESVHTLSQRIVIYTLVCVGVV